MLSHAIHQVGHNLQNIWHWKKPYFKRFVKGDRDIESRAVCFTNPSETGEAIEHNRHNAMVLRFGGKLTDTLAILRYIKKKVVSVTSFVNPEWLPPTASATKHPSLRCYYQIMTWMTKAANLAARDWGWKCESNLFKPVMCSKSPAPEHLLKVVHCNWKSKFKSNEF